MSTPDSLPPIIAPVPAGVPVEMRALRRWAPWRAEWDARKKKWTKIPHRAARPEYGLSNKNATGWVTFDEAMAAYLAHRDKFAGVGYLMTGPHGITGVDLDKCRDPATGKLDDWAADLVTRLDTYTEVSPSGTGLHAMVGGDVPEDWTNHERGIEVYGGNEARFLCVTGRTLPEYGSGRIQRRPASTFEALSAQYRKAKNKADVEDLHLPALVPLDQMPDIADLDLPPHARNFLTDGTAGVDRSQALFAAAIALTQAGLAKDEVLSILEANEHAMGLALDHRRQDYDKALRFLWKHSASAGAARAEDFKRLQWADLVADEPPEDVSDLLGPAESYVTAPGAPSVVDDFDVLPAEEGEDKRLANPAPGKAPQKDKVRFTIVSPAEFLKRKPADWIVKGIVPRAGLAVIYGASGSGKTFLTLDLVGAVARGADWRGATVRRGRVLYVVAEGASGFRNRMEAYCQFHGVDPAEVDIGVLADAPNIREKEDIRALLAAIKAFGRVDVIVIDTYARAMAGGNENDAKDVGEAIAHCDILHRVTGALVILVHHSGKDATKGARGSGALRAAADLEIEVVQTREYRAATITKQKDGEDGQEFQFKLHEVEIGFDDDFDPITSCVVEHSAVSATPAERKENPEGANEKLLMRYLEAIEGPINRAELLDNTFQMLDLDTAPGQKDRRKERLGRAIKSLARKNLLEDDGLFVSLK